MKKKNQVKEIFIAIVTFSLIMAIIAATALLIFPSREVAKVISPVVFLGYLAIVANALFSGKNKDC